jgi:membrane protein
MLPAAALPEGAEFLGLLVVLRHFVAAQRCGMSVDPTTLRLREPYLRSHIIAEYLHDLQRAEMIRRSETGGWLLSRSLDSTDLLRLYRCTSYLLPLHPRAQVEALGISLPPGLLTMLDGLAAALDATMSAHLDQIYPPDDSASISRTTEECAP